MRYRQKGNPIENESRDYNHRYLVYNSNGTVYSDNTYKGTVSQPKESKFQTMQDDPHPGYFTRISKGQLVISPMTLSYRKLSCLPGHVQTGLYQGTAPYWRTGTISGSGSLNYTEWHRASFSYPAEPAISVLSDGQLALNAWANVDPTASKHMEDALEWKQTLSTFRKSPLTHFKDVIDEIKRNKRNVGANAWLKYQNEIVPAFGLLSDAFLGMEHQGRVLHKDVRLRASAKSEDNYNEDHILLLKYLTYDGLRMRYHREKRIEKRAVVYYKLKRSRSGFNQDWGLRFKDLPAGFWNVVRLSYMVDRVYDISSYIRATVNMLDPNVVYEGGCVTTCTKTKCTYDIYSYDNGPNHWSGTLSSPPVSDETKTIVRTIISPPSSLANPSNIDFRPSGLVEDVKKTLDLAALVIQGLKGLR